MATKFITVSIEIMHDTNLNQSQKFLLAEIEQLSSLEKGCIASNEHFSKLIGITKENVSKNINDLKAKGYINIKIVAGSRNHTRIITLTNVVISPYQSSKTPLLKQQETKENKTINKTINNIYPFSEIIEYLNKSASTKYKANNKKTKELIVARFNDGFTLEDFITVIDKKCKEWINDTKMSSYLRPETLFSNKFEGYLNQVVAKSRLDIKNTNYEDQGEF